MKLTTHFCIVSVRAILIPILPIPSWLEARMHMGEINLSSPLSFSVYRLPRSVLHSGKGENQESALALARTRSFVILTCILIQPYDLTLYKFCSLI